MLAVKRPKRELKPPMFYEIVIVERIVAWQPDDARKAFFALVYGSGADISPALQVMRDDINPKEHEVRIRGTKTGNRIVLYGWLTGRGRSSGATPRSSSHYRGYSHHRGTAGPLLTGTVRPSARA
jgi:integrase